jgi:hypothetical protein
MENKVVFKTVVTGYKVEHKPKQESQQQEIKKDKVK